jgi:FKBP-type peptidyl-prolyl cis-trans isomerase
LIAGLSLLANASLVAWLVARQPKPAEPVAPAVTAPVAAPVQTWTRELAPYAALGSFMAENNRIADLKWTPAQFAAFQEGFRASYEGRGLPLDDAAARLRDETSARVQAMAQTEQPDPVRDYFRFLREKENVQQTASGLHYRITEEGTGAPPAATDTVVISYAARLPDGTGVPSLGRTRMKVAVRDLLPGLAEGVQLLRVGGKGLIYLPPALAFREADWPAAIPKGVPLAFFVELHDINPAR